MARGRYGQQIDFAIVYDEDKRYNDFIFQTVKVGDTVRSILGARNRPDMAQEVAHLNKIASVKTVLRHRRKKNPKTGKWIRYPRDRKKIRLPGTLRKSQTLSAYADFGGRAPTIVEGYAKIAPVDRPGRTGISHFTGYDPIRMRLPLTFFALRRPEDEDSPGPKNIEADMDRLERMAGRGDFRGASVGTPALIGISTDNNRGEPVWLIPQNYQWTSSNDTVPLWRIVELDWDDSPLRNNQGYRMRQDVTVTVEAYTAVATVARSVTIRKKGAKKKKKATKKSGRR
jgi:hypothetical protein